jgi:hypothetical protein
VENVLSLGFLTTIRSIIKMTINGLFYLIPNPPPHASPSSIESLVSGLSNGGVAEFLLRGCSWDFKKITKIWYFSDIQFGKTV